MRRIKPMKNGFAEIDGELVNLREFKTIIQRTLGLNEDPENHSKWAIAFTPSVPSAENISNGVNGTYLITYKEGEREDYEADYRAVMESLN